MAQDAFIRVSAITIAGTSLLFAGWALLQPRSLQRRFAITPRHAQLLGYRDLATGGLLLVSPRPATFALRAAADASDLFTMLAKGRRLDAVGAVVFGAWSVMAAIVAANGRRG